MIKISSVALMLCTASLVAVASPQNGPTLSIHFEYNPEEYADVRDLQKQLVKADRKSTRLNSSHSQISYAVFCLKKKKNTRSSSRSTTNGDNKNHMTEAK